MLQQLLNLITNPIFFFVLIAVFGGLGRLWSWLQHERARRIALQARARQETEGIRRGKPLQLRASQTEAGPTPTPAQTSAQDQAARQRALQEQRAAQLRALQQKRLAELRAKRQAGAQGASAAPSAPPPAPKPAPRRGSPVSQSVPQSQRSQAGSQAQRTNQQRPPTPTRIEPGRVTPVAGPATLRPFSAPPARPAGTAPVEVTEIGAAPLATDRPVHRPGVGVPGAGFAALFGAGLDIRRAVLLAEVLGPPVAERNPEQTGAF